MGRNKKTEEQKKPVPKRYFINLEEETRKKYELASRMSGFKWGGKGNPPKLFRSLLQQLSEFLTAGEIMEAADKGILIEILKSKNSDNET